jgi:tRNA A-37 threonylcarbamoyl transferase component Bud32
VKKCSKGVSCLSTCISKEKRCKGVLPSAVGSALTEKIKRLSEEKEGKVPYSEWRVVASGYQGQIAINPEGTRVVKTLFSPEKGEKPEFGPLEVEIATKMGELGHSPKVHSSGPSHLEMDFAKGKPIWKSFRMEEDESPMNPEQARKAGAAVRDLHRLGYFHGDSHSQQFLVNRNDVKLVDYGLSGRLSSNPVKAMQDLAKISKLVGWEKTELSGDPYFSMVSRLLPEYRELQGSKSKKSVARRLEIAEEYLKDLKSL